MTQPAEPSPPPSAKKVQSHKRHPKKLGSGTYGKVTIVERDGKHLARKACKSPQYIELEVLAGVKHPCLPDLVDYAVERKRTRTGYATEYCFYFPVYQELPKHDIPWVKAHLLDIVYDVLSGLMALRVHGWYHRDVKPENVMLDPVSGRFILIDMGLAQKERAAFTHSHFTCTEEYRPLQMLDFPGKYPIGVPYDVWATGFMACYLLSKDEELDSWTSKWDDLEKSGKIDWDGVDPKLKSFIQKMMEMGTPIEMAYEEACELKGVKSDDFGCMKTCWFDVRRNLATQFIEMTTRKTHILQIVPTSLPYALITGLAYLESGEDYPHIKLLVSACVYLAYEYTVCEPSYSPVLFPQLGWDRYDQREIQKFAERVIRVTRGTVSEHQMGTLEEELDEVGQYDIRELEEFVTQMVMKRYVVHSGEVSEDEDSEDTEGSEDVGSDGSDGSVDSDASDATVETDDTGKE